LAYLFKAIGALVPVSLAISTGTLYFTAANKPHAGSRAARGDIPADFAPVASIWGRKTRRGSTGKGLIIMALPTFSMRQLLEAGVHFGHHTRRWNPQMAPYLFGVRNGVHIINLEYTAPMLEQAIKTVRDIAAAGGRVLFVGTKRAAADKVAEAAKRCGQYYVNHRWLGGMLSNWKTISQSIKRLREIEEKLTTNTVGLTKKELLMMTRDRDKLERALGGIKDMGGQPDILVIIDTNKESLAVKEANKLGIPIVAILDSNSSPEGINFPVPGNDDAIRAISLYCDLFSGAVLDGLQQEAISSGADIGEAEELPAEQLPSVEGAENAASA
jgi:small subunit ribosomal protein S2